MYLYLYPMRRSAAATDLRAESWRILLTVWHAASHVRLIDLGWAYAPRAKR